MQVFPPRLAKKEGAHKSGTAVKMSTLRLWSSYNELDASFRPTKLPEIEEGKGHEFEANRTNRVGLKAQ
jgi:hypothetical protein